MGVRLLLYLLVVAPFWYVGVLSLAAIIIVILVYQRSDYLQSWLYIDLGVPVVCALAVRLILYIW
jgi:hypothetical protein